MTQEAGNPTNKEEVNLIPVEQMESMSHDELYRARMKAKTKEEQDHIAPYEHRAFAREWTQERPIVGPLSLAFAIPGYTAAKAMGMTGSRSGASLKQISEGYKGVAEGIDATIENKIKKPWEMMWNRGTEKATTEPLKKAPNQAVEPWKMQWGRGDTTKQEKGSNGQFKLSEYLERLAEVESNNNPNAKAATSSASGLYQFTNATWMEWVNRLDLDYTLKDRNDPEKARIVAEKFTQNNYERAKEALGREPTKTEVYMYHLLGSAGEFLSANPEDEAVKYVGKKAAKANKNIFYKEDGKSKTVKEVLDFFRKKFDGKKG